MPRLANFARRRPGLSLLILSVVAVVSFTGFRVIRAQLALRRGERLYEAQRYAEAAAEFRVTLQVIPDLPEVRYWRGNALGLSHQVNEAIPEFRRAVELEPQNPTYVTALAHGLGMQNRNDEAVHYYRLAVQLKPDDAELRVGPATRLLHTEVPGAPTQAEKELREALRIQPDHRRAKDGLRVLRENAVLLRQGR